MAGKTAIAAKDDGKTRFCDKHNIPLKYSRKLKMWYCTECLHASFLTHQAQQDAVRRYRQSEKGKKAERDYELSEGGKKTREKYLKSEKYKEARKRYNEALRESLRIARAAQLERASAPTEVEIQKTEAFAPLIQDIREFIDSLLKNPTAAEVVKWAKDTYDYNITLERAKQLIEQAEKRRG